MKKVSLLIFTLKKMTKAQSFKKISQLDSKDRTRSIIFFYVRVFFKKKIISRSIHIVKNGTMSSFPMAE